MHDLRKASVGVLIALMIVSLLLSPTSHPIEENLCKTIENPSLSSSADTSQAASITSIALRSVKNLLRACYDHSITQLEVTNYIDALMRAEGSDGVLSFPTYIMSTNEADKPYCYSNDDATHIINPSSEPVITIRAGARVNSLCCDTFRTYLFDSATQEMIDAYSAVLNTQLSVIETIAPGVKVAELDAIVQSELSSYISQPNMTYSYYWGHSTGAFAVEEPYFSNETVPTVLVQGQIFTVQIWLYLDDVWYIRVEDTVLVTSTGVEVLSDAPKELEDIMIHSNSAYVDSELAVDLYEFGELTTVNATINDSTNRTIVSVDFFNGRLWTPMQNQENNTFSSSYLLDYTIPSYVEGLVRIILSNETIYTMHELEYNVEYSSLQVLEPPVKIVVEQVTTDIPMRWVFSQVSAEMIRIHFLKVYPPPGDQLLVRDVTGRVIFEYKWNFGDPDVSPWVPGNTLFVDVIPTHQSIYGGVNHFFFEVDLIWVLDVDAPTNSTTTTVTNPITTSPTSSTEITNSITDATFRIDSTWILIGGLFCICAGFLGVIKLRSRKR